MNIILGYSALAGIVSALIFTSLAQKHIAHVAGLAVIAMAIVCGLGGQFEVAFRWFCIGTIVTGLSGCLERLIKKLPRQ